MEERTGARREAYLLIVLLGRDEVGGDLGGLGTRLEGGTSLLCRVGGRGVHPESSTTERSNTDSADEGRVAALLGSLGRVLAERGITERGTRETSSRRGDVDAASGGPERGERHV